MMMMRWHKPGGSAEVEMSDRGSPLTALPREFKEDVLNSLWNSGFKDLGFSADLVKKRTMDLSSVENFLTW